MEEQQLRNPGIPDSPTGTGGYPSGNRRRARHPSRPFGLGLAASTTFTYGIVARSETETSEVSNLLTARTKDIPRILARPRVGLTFNPAVGSITVEFQDSSNVEVEFRIYRHVGNGNRTTVKVLARQDPRQFDAHVSWTDTGLAVNAVYAYSVSAVDDSGNESQSEWSRGSLLRLGDFVPAGQKALRLGARISEFPVRLRNWALKNGDWIAVQEEGIPDSAFTLLDVRDISNPRFDGFGSVPPDLRKKRTAWGSSILTVSNFPVRINSYELDSNGSIRASSLPVPTSAYPQDENVMDDFMAVHLDDSTTMMGIHIQDYYDYALHFFLAVRKGAPALPSKSMKIGTDGFTFVRSYRGKVFLRSWASSGGNCNSSSDVLEFTGSSLDPSLLPVERTSCQNATPDRFDFVPHTIGPYAVRDSLLIKAPHTFLDTAKRCVFVIEPNRLSIFGYTVEDFVLPMAIRNPGLPGQTVRAPKSALRFDPVRSELVLDPALGITRVEILDLRGRLMASFAGAPTGGLIPVRLPLAGLHVARLTGAPGQTWAPVYFPSP